MGTDIHLRVERRNPVTNQWENIPDAFPSWPYPKDDEGNIIWPDDSPDDRNYNIFAFLAGVRNGYGFAGVYRHEPLKPQFPKRGLPDDIDKTRLNCEAKGIIYNGPDTDDYDSYDWLGDHSFTWATITELRACPWEAEFESGGVISMEEYKAWKDAGASGPPSTWSGGISGQDIETWTAEAFEAYEGAMPEGKQIFIQIHWTWKPLLNSGFYRWVHGNKVEGFVRELGGENVRVIMGFDN